MSDAQSPKTITSLDEQTFRARAAELSALVDEELERVLIPPYPVPNLHDGVLYSLGLDQQDLAARGKRLRPVLCLMTAEALGKPAQNALAFACAIELLHNFALVHDDIEDGDEHRRGRPATWVRYGLAHGINIGDYMLARVFALLFRDPLNPLATREQLLDLLHKTLEHLFTGQSMDITARGRRDFTTTDYEAIVLMKTGSYLVAPIMGGAIVGGADEDMIESLTRFGRALGPLFQVKDDLIDLTTGKGRGAIGNDIREGKRSYLVAAASDACSPADRERLYDILDAPRGQTTTEQVEWAVSLFRTTGAIDRAEEYCRRLRDRANAAIEPLPTALREMLTVAVELMLRRTQ